MINSYVSHMLESHKGMTLKAFKDMSSQ